MALVKEDVAHDVAIKTAAAGEISLRYYDLGGDSVGLTESDSMGPSPSSSGGSTREVAAGRAASASERVETNTLPLVMLHGGGPGASSWSNFGSALEGFAADFRTILVDQPGFGASDKPPVVGNYYRFAGDAVIALLDELGLEKVHLLGNSLGGGTAMRIALTYPDRVGRLVLMGPGGLSLNLFHADPTEGVQRLMDFSGAPTREALKAFISTMVVDQSLVTDALVEERFADATAPGAREAMASMGWSFYNPETAEDGMLWREAHRLKHHTLLTWGREDRVNPLDGAFPALKLIPKAQLHVFPRCGHWAQIEAADEFREVAVSFLKRHRERTPKEK